MKVYIFLSCCALCLGSFSWVHCDDSLLDAAMTQREKEAIGIDRLNSMQKRAFERWLEEWTRTVINKAPTYHPSLSLQQWVAIWKQKQFEESRLERENPQEALHRIFRNRNGQFLELNDGSVWEITSFDQPTASLWKRGDTIVFTKSERDLSRPYTITNIDRNEIVGAKQKRAAAPSGKRQEDPVSYFSGSIQVESVGMNGETVQLRNGKVWDIAPVDQVRVVIDWKPFDRVRVEKNNDIMFPIKLQNLDNGGYVLAAERKNY